MTSQYLRNGVPQDLRFVAVYACGTSLAPEELVKEGFPMVKVLRMDSNYWTVLANGELEMWPQRRTRFHAAEWLEWLGCEDGIDSSNWRDPQP
jgi:hypothetical protein